MGLPSILIRCAYRPKLSSGTRCVCTGASEKDLGLVRVDYESRENKVEMCMMCCCSARVKETVCVPPKKNINSNVADGTFVCAHSILERYGACCWLL